MQDLPWTGDASSLVDAFRAGERSPREELTATLDAIERSKLNAFSYLDADRALDAASSADTSLPFGGVPMGIKELEAVAGWPFTEGSIVFRARIAEYSTTHVERILGPGGVVPVGLTTSSEFGGLNVSVTKLNGVTHSPWRHGRTVGGSSAGSAAAVAGGLVALASGGDGGGSIRIPAGYTGLLGMKGTFGRIPRGPKAYMRPHTVVLGNLSRSVRDAARYFDVCGGPHATDPTSLPRHPSFEAALGTHDLRGKRVGIVPALGGVRLEDGVETQLRSRAELLIADTGLVPVDLDIELPNLAAQWMVGNLATLLADLGERWPGCAAELTDEVAAGLYLSQSLYNLRLAAISEELRVQAGCAMADAFAQVDFIIAATNPGPAFAADAPTSNPSGSALESALDSTAGKLAMRAALAATRVAASFAPTLPNIILEKAAARDPDFVTMGALTMISNLYGNPAVSIPAGTVRGLPVGMQVLAPRHADSLLFDVALAVERERPWPMTAAGLD